MTWYGHDMGLVALLIGILTVAMVIAVILRVFERAESGALRRRPTPDELLAERYARGEITDEEYRHRMSVLHGDGHSIR
ncbi:MAG TPA: SHOCT domain-containing protein [Micromonosporaceae bacterium]|nr:SHOCT domain-containing protein [Micromonosporaceae bacterium]